MRSFEAVDISYSDEYIQTVSLDALKISSNVQETFQTINSLRRDSITRKRVREDNLEHARNHSIMFPKF
jgi:hypothetical protein